MPQENDAPTTHERFIGAVMRQHPGWTFKQAQQFVIQNLASEYKQAMRASRFMAEQEAEQAIGPQAAVQDSPLVKAAEAVAEAHRARTQPGTR